MAVKRLNYFTSQFLVEQDFKDEQDYHISMRRRLNKSLHTWGVASGLTVARASNRSVTISPGIAIDSAGRELVVTSEPASYVLIDDIDREINMKDQTPPYTLTVTSPNADVYLCIIYNDKTLDSKDHYKSTTVENYIRTCEVPVIYDTINKPTSDGTVVILAMIHLDSSGNIANDTDVNSTIVKKVGGAVAPGSISTAELADNAVTLNKMDLTARPGTIEGVSNPGGNIDLVNTGAITIEGNDTTKQIIIGENHSSLTSNPHATTAAQIDADTNAIVTQINAGSGVIAEPRIALTISRTSHKHTAADIDAGTNAIVNQINTGTGVIGESHIATSIARVSSYDFKNKFITPVKFTEVDKGGAFRKINLSFKPRFVFTNGFCNTVINNVKFGANASGMADLTDLNNYQSTTGIKTMFLNNIPYFSQSCYLKNALFSTEFCDEDGGDMFPSTFDETVSVTITSVSATNEVTVTLSRAAPTSTSTLKPLSNFTLELSLIFYG